MNELTDLTDFTNNDSFDDAWVTQNTSSGDITSTSDITNAVTSPPTAQKRVYPGQRYGAPPAKRTVNSIRLGAGYKWNLQALAQAAAAVETGGKSPVSALNELGVRVAYSVLRQGGPAHCPSFTVAVAVADMTFEGWGHSKREARVSAARACLAALLARAGRVLPAVAPQDFTNDDPKYTPLDFQWHEEVQSKPVDVEMTSPETPAVVSPAASAGSALFGVAGPAAHKSPINSLYESCPGLSFHCTFGDGSPLDQPQAPLQLSHSMRFKVVCQIKDQNFEGYGSSKKLAKLAAARAALAVLEEGRAPAAAPALPGRLPQPLADRISQLVNEKFHELMKGDLVHSKRKVLAGIVMTIDDKLEGAKVIAVTTGTKCVSGEHMSVRGRAVNDCHAEVAARRCLQRHLYAQLLMYAEAKDPTVPIAQSDLEPVPGGGYQLKPDRQLHLYVSTAPCGDSRIFSPHEQPGPAPDRHPNRLARGQLRTKIESGEGTIPVKNCTNVVQTWDGVMQGERLLTMSCSDKVCRWCVAGLQGALLARLLRPVYLRSLVLGSLLHPHHLYRAICGRIEQHLVSLPPPFRLQRPLLARAASTEARTPARAPSFSVCWADTSPLPEVINATTGKLESGQPSLLCKQSMFARWQHLVTRLPLLPQEEGEPAPMPADVDALLYNEAKQLCPAYQVAKERLIEAFDKAKLGHWIKKPIEQDQFICEIVDAAPAALFAWTGPAPNRAAAQQGTGGDRGSHESPHTLRDKVDSLNDNQNDHIQIGNDLDGHSRCFKGFAEDTGKNENVFSSNYCVDKVFAPLTRKYKNGSYNDQEIGVDLSVDKNQTNGSRDDKKAQLAQHDIIFKNPSQPYHFKLQESYRNENDLPIENAAACNRKVHAVNNEDYNQIVRNKALAKFKTHCQGRVERTFNEITNAKLGDRNIMNVGGLNKVKHVTDGDLNNLATSIQALNINAEINYLNMHNDNDTRVKEHGNYFANSNDNANQNDCAQNGRNESSSSKLLKKKLLYYRRFSNN